MSLAAFPGDLSSVVLLWVFFLIATAWTLTLLPLQDTKLYPGWKMTLNLWALYIAIGIVNLS